MMVNGKPTNCDNCGACCMGQNLLPLSGNMVDDVGRVSQLLQAALEAVLRGPLTGDDGCPCIWLDRMTGKCMNYELRPSICRDVIQVGDDTCMRIREHAAREAEIVDDA